MLCRLVITFLPRSKCLLISWLQSPSIVILEPKKRKSVTASTFPPLFVIKWWDRMAMILQCCLCFFPLEACWALKNWCFWTVVLEKTLESPLDCKVIQTVHSKGDQSWVFIGWTDAEAETPILWPPDAKSWLIWKDSCQCMAKPIQCCKVK